MLASIFLTAADNCVALDIADKVFFIYLCRRSLLLSVILKLHIFPSHVYGLRSDNKRLLIVGYRIVLAGRSNECRLRACIYCALNDQLAVSVALYQSRLISYGRSLRDTVVYVFTDIPADSDRSRSDFPYKSSGFVVCRHLIVLVGADARQLGSILACVSSADRSIRGSDRINVFFQYSVQSC